MSASPLERNAFGKFDAHGVAKPRKLYVCRSALFLVSLVGQIFVRYLHLEQRRIGQCWLFVEFAGCSPHRERARSATEMRRGGLQTRTLAVKRRLQAGGQLGALPNGALGIEFERQRRTSDDVRVDSMGAQVAFELTHRLLAGADHHVVDLE